MCSADCVIDLHDSVLQASGNEKFIGFHVEDEVGSDRLWEILECKIKHFHIYFHVFFLKVLQEQRGTSVILRTIEEHV